MNDYHNKCDSARKKLSALFSETLPSNALLHLALGELLAIDVFFAIVIY
jgi:hypothetical protein